MNVQEIETSTDENTFIHCVLIRRGKMIGICKLTHYVDDNSCVFSDLVIKKEHRGKHYSEILQNHCEVIAKNRFKSKEIYLWCTNNWRRKLYELRGYNYTVDHQSISGSIWMVKEL